MANTRNTNATDQRQQIKELTDQLEQGIRSYMESDRYKDYLTVMGRFTNYSIRNTILIAMQRPDATMVAGYTAWQKNFGRQVNRGEHAIKILAPMTYKKTKERDMLDPVTNQPMIDESGRIMKEEVEVTVPGFRVTNVFDVAQTSGRPLPTLVDDLVGDVRGFRDFMEAVRRISPVPIAFEEMEGKDGYYHQVEKRIAINDDLSERQAMAAVIHELAHAKIHALDPENLRESAKARGKDTRTMEVEAESVSFVVNSRLGIDTSANSFGYVASWSKNKELPELHASLQVIKDTSAEIISGIELELSEIRRAHVTKEEALEAIDQRQIIYRTPERGDFQEVTRAEIEATEDDADFRMGRAEWRHYKEVQAEMDLVPTITAFQEAELLLTHENQFGIYQIDPETKGRFYMFVSHEFMDEHDMDLDHADYRLAYTGELSEEMTLDTIYEQFNMNRPEDFTGHSLSVSDVVVINKDGEVKAYFVDSFGFAEIPEFLEGYLMPGQELEQAVFKISDRYIEMHQTDGGYDYSIYDQEYHLLDGGMYESDVGIIPAVRDLATDLKEPVFNTETEQYERTAVQGEVYAGDRLYRLPDQEYHVFMEKAEKANQIPAEEKTGEVHEAGGRERYQPLRKVEELKEQNYNMIDNILNNGYIEEEKREIMRQAAMQYQQKTGAYLTFYAAVCDEFPGLGEFTGNLTLKEAADRYREILKDPTLAHMGNGMGFVLHDPMLPDYSDSELALVMGKTVCGNNLDAVEPFLTHPLILEALEEIREEFPDFKYVPPMPFLETIYPKKMTAQQLATEMIKLAEEFDIYEFRDKVENPDDLQMEMEYNLLSGKKMEYAPFLNDVIEESPILMPRAEILLERLKEYEPEVVKNMVPIVKIQYSEFIGLASGKYQNLKEMDMEIASLDKEISEKQSATAQVGTIDEKTYTVQFSILYAEEGKVIQLNGKIELGAGNGGLIDSLKADVDEKLHNQSWLQFYQSKGEEAYQKQMTTLHDLQDHILPYLQEFCSLQERTPVAQSTEKTEMETTAAGITMETLPAQAKEEQKEKAQISKEETKTTAAEKATVVVEAKQEKRSIHERLKENKEKLAKMQGKGIPQRGVELA